MSGHFFEDPAHGARVVRCIGEGVLPLRFAYAGSAAYTHDRLAWSEGYRAVIGSVDLEMRVLAADPIGACAMGHIVEIGPGNGVHTVEFLRSLSARGMHCRRYLGLDFSATLLTLACARIREAFGAGVSLASDVWDIESGGSSAIERWRCGLECDCPLLVCLLGHTLGNVESGIQALKHVHRSLRPGDRLVVGVALDPPVADRSPVLAPYRTDIFRAAALEPLHAAGVDTNDIEFDVRFSDGSVIGEAVFLRSVRIGQLNVQAGHVLRCFRSRRFAMKDVRSLFIRAGWSIRTLIEDDDREHAVVLAMRGAS